MSRAPYHSALHAPLGHPPLERWEGHGSIAMLADLPRLPAEFLGCDVVYMDPPWDAGYAEFNRRAGVRDAPAYGDWLRSVDDALRVLALPAVVVLGKRGSRILSPDWTAPVTLNGAPAVAAVYGLPGGALDGCGTSQAVIRRLAERFVRVLDPCAGYGRTGRIFAEAGRTFVLADSNPECIGYIAAHAGGWFK